MIFNFSRDNEQETVVQHVRLAHSKKGPVSLLHAVHRCSVCGFAAGTKRHVQVRLFFFFLQPTSTFHNRAFNPRSNSSYKTYEIIIFLILYEGFIIIIEYKIKASIRNFMKQ